MSSLGASELVFKVTKESDGGYSAECVTENIFTQGDTWEELRANVKDAVEAFFFDAPVPSILKLNLPGARMDVIRRNQK
jgi:predicted RNase H-like HicB family nuclease